jgi:FlaA1/EpsC-like NDP-sugar epimerase
VEEAVGLILSVTRADGGSGAYFMEMGDPVSILELAREMIARSGRKIGVNFTGLRPGEKLREDLFDAAETVVDAGLPGVSKVVPRFASAALSTAAVDDLERIARGADDPVVAQKVFACLDARLGREERAAG